MEKQIRFPNLGIVLENVGKNIKIGNFTIAYYGILIGLGVIIGLLIAMMIAKKTGQKTDVYYDVAIISMLAGIPGARIYYVVFSWDYYKDHLNQIFNIRGGGLAIYGGIIFALVALIIYSKIKKQSVFLILDTIVPGVAIAQAMGRWGNFFNREAFGEYTNSLFAMQLPLKQVNSATVTELMKQNIEVINGTEFIQVHPTFLYESLWNILVCIFLIIMTKHKKYNGQIMILYFLGYGLGRVWIEGLRTDQLIIGHTGIPVSQLLAAIIIICSIIALIIAGNKNKKKS